MRPLVTADDAVAIFNRKIPDAKATATPAYHPFWWSTLQVSTRGLISRRKFDPLQVKSALPNSMAHTHGQAIDVLVNACTNHAYIADFRPHGEETDDEQWLGVLRQPAEEARSPAPEDATLAARALVRVKVLKTVKLGVRVKIDSVAAPRRVLKPNWLVTGANDNYAATFLVDGFNGTHYVVRAKRLS